MDSPLSRGTTLTGYNCDNLFLFCDWVAPTSPRQTFYYGTDGLIPAPFSPDWTPHGQIHSPPSLPPIYSPKSPGGDCCRWMDEIFANNFGLWLVAFHGLPFLFFMMAAVASGMLSFHGRTTSSVLPIPRNSSSWRYFAFSSSDPLKSASSHWIADSVFLTNSSCRSKFYLSFISDPGWFNNVLKEYQP